MTVQEEEAIQEQSYFFYFSSPTQFSWTYTRGSLKFFVNGIPDMDMGYNHSYRLAQKLEELDMEVEYKAPHFGDFNISLKLKPLSNSTADVDAPSVEFQRGEVLFIIHQYREMESWAGVKLPEAGGSRFFDQGDNTKTGWRNRNKERQFITRERP